MPAFSVLIPTRNCAVLVPGHLESLRSWLDLAEEVIVVDSYSKDGTVELLRAGLDHPHIKFLTHPPGLYQSWNFGIQNVRTKYVYLSTVGDSITRTGLKHLLSVAEEFHSDVVISKPHLINEAGDALPDKRWPIDDILVGLRATSPLWMSATEQFLFAVTNPWGTILGSSASNLYLAECLKERPFPVEYGTGGDGAWGIKNAFAVRLAVTPERFSTFREHEKTYCPSEYFVESLACKLFLLAQSVVDEHRRNPRIGAILEQLRWSEMKNELGIVPYRQAQLEAYRNGKVPWFFQPAAWNVRFARNQAQRKIRRLTGQVLASLRQKEWLDLFDSNPAPAYFTHCGAMPAMSA